MARPLVHDWQSGFDMVLLHRVLAVGLWSHCVRDSPRGSLVGLWSCCTRGGITELLTSAAQFPSLGQVMWSTCYLLTSTTPRFTRRTGSLWDAVMKLVFVFLIAAQAADRSCQKDNGTRGNMRSYRSRFGCCPASAVTHGNQGNQEERKGSLQLHIHRDEEFAPCRTVIHSFNHPFIQSFIPFKRKAQDFLCAHVFPVV